MLFRWLHRLLTLFAPRSERSSAQVEGDVSPTESVRSSEAHATISRGTARSGQDDDSAPPRQRSDRTPKPKGEPLGDREPLECDVVIGFDFGTSATKVVVRTPDLPGERAVPVDFRDLGQPENTFLIPSQLWISKDGICGLSTTRAAKRIENLKVGLFEHRSPWPDGDRGDRRGQKAEAIATAYMALVLMRTQDWFEESQKDVIGHFTSLNWSLNLGVPSPHVGDNPQSRRFLRVGAAAWLLAEYSRQQGRNDVSLEQASDCLEQATRMQSRAQPEHQLTCDFEIVPEIVAAAVGYARSNERNDGLHMMIDIGASTMDVCSFLLGTRQGDDRYSLCTADVGFLGMVAYEASSGNERKTLKERCSRMLSLAVQELRTSKAPNESVWTRGNSLPVLLIGGGSKVAFYKGLVDDLESAVWDGFRVNNDGVSRPSIPIPETIRHNRGEFHRLAVAWGLSYRSDDIGDVIPPEQVGAVEPIRKSFKRMLTKDEM